ncbi:uncharacterized protein N7503_011281 [Penicillium pulvis]|uniref:uncharacterized protein n=1 Tax=Penicillium pulvis TaxID=1562058 RepID=UPI002548E5C4|nr:uncharacterized protein N7503_011281 [Penicillium pulvis]KAJ5786069.1 hypothetical protein N7503_011281 [Penicillium pulvis]
MRIPYPGGARHQMGSTSLNAHHPYDSSGQRQVADLQGPSPNLLLSDITEFGPYSTLTHSLVTSSGAYAPVDRRYYRVSMCTTRCLDVDTARADSGYGFPLPTGGEVPFV